MQKARYSSHRRGLPGRQEARLSFLLSLGTDAFLQVLVLSLDSESLLGQLCTLSKQRPCRVLFLSWKVPPGKGKGGKKLGW